MIRQYYHPPLIVPKHLGTLRTWEPGPQPVPRGYPTEIVEKMKILYQPNGEAREYAGAGSNPYVGCDHACTYCYGPSAQRKSPEEFQHPVVRAMGPAKFLARVEREAKLLADAGVTNVPIHLSFLCDPYMKLDRTENLTRCMINILHTHGIPVQILSKAGEALRRDFDIFMPNDAIGATVVMLDDQLVNEWEPNAPHPRERLAILKEAKGQGLATWVSLEPAIYWDETMRVIEESHEFVDLYKFGKLNYKSSPDITDWGEFGRAVIAKLESVNAAYYIKESIREYLDPATSAFVSR